MAPIRLPRLRLLSTRFMSHARAGRRVVVHGTALLSAFIFFRDHFADVQSVSGSSMAPTISPNSATTGAEDVILVLKHRGGRRGYNDNPDSVLGNNETDGKIISAWDRWGTQNIERGDVVTFWSPVSGQVGLKRVIALGGDIVEPEKRVQYGNRYRLPQPNELMGTAKYRIPERMRVPYGYLWIEGDDPDSSHDSRDFGPVSHALVNGKVVAIVSPLSRAGWMSTDRPIRKTSTKVTPGITQIPIDYYD